MVNWFGLRLGWDWFVWVVDWCVSLRLRGLSLLQGCWFYCLWVLLVWFV